MEPYLFLWELSYDLLSRPWGFILSLIGCLHVFKRLALHLGVYDHVNSSHRKIPGYLTPHDEFALGWVNAAAGQLRKRDWSMAGRFSHPALEPTTLLSERYWSGRVVKLTRSPPSINEVKNAWSLYFHFCILHGVMHNLNKATTMRVFYYIGQIL
jgi:hypothetical protein